MQDPLYFRLVLLACAVVLVAGARYVVQPVRLRKRLTYAAHPDILPIDRDQQHPGEVGEFFKRADQPLRTLGYQLVGESVNPNFAERFAASNRVFINRTTRTMAILVVGYRKNASGASEFKWTTIAIRTDSADGFHVVTSNAGPLNARPSRPNLKSIRFAKIKSPTVLHLIHVAFVERHFASKIPDLVLDSKFNGDVARLTQWFASQEIEQLVQTGYFYLDVLDDKFRPTLKGACLTAWKNSWPWKQLRVRNRDREAARVLREIGLNEQGRPRAPLARPFPSEVVRARAAGAIPPDFRGDPEGAPPRGS